MAGQDIHIGVMLERLNRNMDQAILAMTENVKFLEQMAIYAAANAPPPSLSASENDKDVKLMLPSVAFSKGASVAPSGWKVGVTIASFKCLATGVIRVEYNIIRLQYTHSSGSLMARIRITNGTNNFESATQTINTTTGGKERIFEGGANVPITINDVVSIQSIVENTGTGSTAYGFTTVAAINTIKVKYVMNALGGGESGILIPV